MRRSDSSESLRTAFFKMPPLPSSASAASGRSRRPPVRVEHDPEQPILLTRTGSSRRRRNDAASSSECRPMAGTSSLISVGVVTMLVFSLLAVLKDESTFSTAYLSRAAMGGEGSISFRRFLAESNAKYTHGPATAAETVRRAAELDGRYLKRATSEEQRVEAEINDRSGEDLALFGMVHTFFSPIDPHTRLPTDKLNTTDKVMLDTWRAAWESQGWKTKILTIEDAKKHPDYPKYNAALDEVPLGANAYYNRLCFLRWLAMAAAGGGYMSDFDVVPIRPPPVTAEDVPAKFAVYGSGVPTLLSGSVSEWDRMARLLLQKALFLNHENKRNLWSDMMVLQELRLPKDENYLMKHETLSGLEALKRIELNLDDCSFLRSDGRGREGGFRAVHFSHFDMKEAFMAGYLRGGAGKEGTKRVDYNDRPRVMKEFMESWSRQCAGKVLKLDVANVPLLKKDGERGSQQTSIREGRDIDASTTGPGRPMNKLATPSEQRQIPSQPEIKQ